MSVCEPSAVGTRGEMRIGWRRGLSQALAIRRAYLRTGVTEGSRGRPSCPIRLSCARREHSFDAQAGLSVIGYRAAPSIHGVRLRR